MKALIITTLPGDLFTLSTDPLVALRESQLRTELQRFVSRADIIEHLVFSAKQFSVGHS